MEMLGLTKLQLLIMELTAFRDEVELASSLRCLMMVVMKFRLATDSLLKVCSVVRGPRPPMSCDKETCATKPTCRHLPSTSCQHSQPVNPHKFTHNGSKNSNRTSDAALCTRQIRRRGFQTPDPRSMRAEEQAILGAISSYV